MRITRHALLAGALALAGVPSGLQAAATTSGAGRAEVVIPGQIQALEDMRFGAIVRPVGASTVTVAPNGAVSATGEIAANLNIPQPPEGRGPARFRLDGTERRAFVALLPSSITLSNGGATMQVRNITSNLPRLLNRFDASGLFFLNIGGTLEVNGGQQTGQYSGEFDVTVIFL